MRLNIRAKIILIGAGLSTLLMLVAFLVSFLVYRERAKDTFYKSLDTCAEELNKFFYTDNICADVSDIYGYVIVQRYNNDPNNEQMDEYLANRHKDDPSVLDNMPEYQKKYEYYSQDKYGQLYIRDGKIGGLGLSWESAAWRSTYFQVSAQLTAAYAIKGVNYAFVAYRDADRNRLVYLIDCTYRLNSTYDENSRLTGDYVEVSEQNISAKPNENGYGDFEIGEQTYLFFDLYYDTVDNEDNKVHEYIGTAYIVYDEHSVQSEINSFLYTELIALFAATIVLVIAYAIIAYFVIVKNITKLNESTKSFTKRALEGEKLEVIDPSVKSKDELGVLSDSFVALEQEIIRYTDKIASDAQEKANMNAELNIATQIQMEDLPASSYADDKVTIAASITPAKEVGGDFYDYFYIDDKHLAVIVADVSGKGVPAALFMMKAKELIKTKLREKKALADTMFEVNNTLLEGNKTGLFVTAFVGIIDIKTKAMQFVSAGHERPYLVGDEIVRVEEDANFVLGGIKNFKYAVNNIKIDDKRLFVFTDGLNEAINNDNQEFDYAGIVRSLESSKDLGFSGVLDAVKSDLKDFVGDKEAFDDVTLLLIELARPNELNLTFTSPDLSVIETVTDKFNETFKHAPKETLAKMDIVIDEMLNNYVSYESNKQGYQISVCAKEIDGVLSLVFITNGDEFDTLSIKDKHINDATEGEIGGFGITITRSIADDIKYERKGGKNILIVKKKI